VIFTKCRARAGRTKRGQDKNNSEIQQSPGNAEIGGPLHVWCTNFHSQKPRRGQPELTAKVLVGPVERNSQLKKRRHTLCFKRLFCKSPIVHAIDKVFRRRQTAFSRESLRFTFKEDEPHGKQDETHPCSWWRFICWDPVMTCWHALLRKVCTLSESLELTGNDPQG